MVLGAATSVETSSVSERHTTGVPWMAAPYWATVPHAKIPRRMGTRSWRAGPFAAPGIHEIAAMTGTVRCREAAGGAE